MKRYCKFRGGSEGGEKWIWGQGGIYPPIEDLGGEYPPPPLLMICLNLQEKIAFFNHKNSFLSLNVIQNLGFIHEYSPPPLNHKNGFQFTRKNSHFNHKNSFLSLNFIQKSFLFMKIPPLLNSAPWGGIVLQGEGYKKISRTLLILLTWKKWCKGGWGIL